MFNKIRLFFEYRRARKLHKLLTHIRENAEKEYRKRKSMF